MRVYVKDSSVFNEVHSKIIDYQSKGKEITRLTLEPSDFEAMRHAVNQQRGFKPVPSYVQSFRYLGVFIVSDTHTPRIAVERLAYESSSSDY